MKILKSTAGFAIIRIPDELNFDDLHLTLDTDTGVLEFDWALLRQILEANAELTLRSEGEVIDLICAWYSNLRYTGYRHEIAERYFKSSEATKVFGVERTLSGRETLH